MTERDIALIDELRTSESALVEFKQNNFDPKLEPTFLASQ